MGYNGILSISSDYRNVRHITLNTAEISTVLTEHRNSVIDEIQTFWDLNTRYSQELSMLLVNVVWFFHREIYVWHFEWSLDKHCISMSRVEAGSDWEVNQTLNIRGLCKALEDYLEVIGRQTIDQGWQPWCFTRD